MVGCRSHGADSVVSRWKTTCYDSGQKTFSVTSIVDTLEEGELGSIEGSGWVERVAHVLNCDMSVTDYETSGECLRSRIVGCIGVGKGSGDKVGHLDGDVE